MILDYAEQTGRFYLRTAYHERMLAQAEGGQWNATRREWALPAFFGPEYVRNLAHRATDYSIPFGIEPDALRELERRKAYVDRAALFHSGQVEPYERQGLDPYQGIGARFLAEYKHVILADGIGVGKTRESIAAADAVGAQRIFIAASKTLITQWWRSIDELLGRQSVAVLRASDKELPSARWVIGTYEAAVKHAVQIAAFRPEVVIADEAVRLKNRKAKRTAAFRVLCSGAPYIWLLTATPVRNHPEELWSLLNILDPERFTSYWAYINRYVVALQNDYGVVLGGIKPWNAAEYHELLVPYILRRTKEQVLMLPPVTEEKVWLSLEGEAAKQYANMEKYFVAFNDAGEAIATPNALTRLLRLRQIACDPGLLDINGESVKTEWLMDWLEGEGEGHHKVLAFTPFAQYAERVHAAYLQRFGDGCVLLTGSMSQAQRDESVRRFMDDPDCRLFVLTEAGGEGLNLQAADVVVLLNKPWTPDQVDQWIGRSARRGQENAVHVYHLVVINSVDQDIEVVLDRKEELASEALAMRSVVEQMLQRLRVPSHR